MREVHGWRRVRRWLGATALGLIGLVVLAVIGVVLVMQTGWGRELVRKQVQAKLESTFVGGATIGHIEGTPFTDIVIRDLVINGPDRKPAIKVGALHLHADVLPLISHELVLSKLVAGDVDVLLDRDDHGELRVKHLMKPGPPSTWNVLLPQIAVHRAHVRFDTGSEVIDLDGLDIDANARLPHGGPVDVGAIVHASWRQRGAPIDIAAILHSDQQEMRVPSALVRIADIVVAAETVRIPKVGAMTGAVVANVPAATIDRLLPQVHVPLDVTLTAEATPVQGETRVALGGELGGAPLTGYVHGDPNAKRAAGFLQLSGLDLYAATTGAVDGIGSVLATFDVAAAQRGEELPRANLLVTATSEHADIPRIDAVASIATGGDRAHFALDATGAAGLRAAVDVTARKHGDEIALEQAALDATTRDPALATGGKAQVHGALDAHLTASGALAPHADLAIAGHVDGKQLRVKDLSASSLALRINAAHVPQQPIGSARLELQDLVRGDLELGKLTVAAGNRPDRKIQVSVRSQPKRAPWLVDLDALVTPGDTVSVDLQRHFVRAAGGATWRGTTGHLAIGPDKIELRDLKSASADGSLALAAEYIRAGRGAGDLSAKLDTSIDLSNIQKGRSGRVDASVDVQRRARRWDGKVDLDASGLSVSQVAFDAQAKIRARSGRVTADVEANSVRAGRAKLAVDLDAPFDLANARAWKALSDRAIRAVDLELHGIDLRAVAKLAHTKPLQGSVDGEVKIADGKTNGTIHVRGARGEPLHDLGAVSADLKIEQQHRDELATTATAQIEKIGQIAFDARLATPDRVFDPAAWRRLGPAALKGAHVKTGELAFEPGTLEKAGIASLLRGRIAFDAEVGAALRDARVKVDVRDLHGGVITMPVAVHLDASIDERAAKAAFAVHANGLEIVRARADSPLALDRLRADPKAARQAPLRATIEIPHVAARPLMAVLGNTQVTGGTLDGKITVGGTVGKPTANAEISARDVTVPPGENGAPVPLVKQFELRGSWDGAAGKVTIAASETNGGTLRIIASGSPAAPNEIAATVDATKIDIAPLVAFLPGPAGGLAGRLDAKLALRGIDPKTAQLGGSLHVSEGRIPIAPAIGTLFHGDVGLNVRERMVTVAATGKLGRGDVQLYGTAPLDPDAPSGEVKIKVHKVQLIGTTEPIIDGVIDARLARANDAWHANIKVANTSVHIPEEKGQKLAPVGAPPDIVYGGPAHHTPPTQVEGTPPHRAPPNHPTLVADLDLTNTKVESKEIRGNVHGRLHITVGGNEVGITGSMWLDHGDLDLFDRRYNVDRAAVHFDGSIDPVLDVRITHDFPDVTTITEIHGRASKPELELSSQPALYSRAELLGFLLGGEPGGDPNNAPSAAQRVAQAGESYIANKVGGYVKHALPVDIDVLRYEASTSSSSAAVTVGTWLTHELFLAYRQHLEARPDENAGEGEVEYWLRRRLVLEGTVGDRGYDGVDLLWRRRW